MPPPYSEITAPPVVVPLAVLVLAVLLRRLHRRGALTVPRVLVAAVVCAYGAGVVANTLFPIALGKGGSGVSWWQYPNLTPLANTEPFDMLSNVVVFVPLGVLLPLVGRVRSAGRVLLWAFLISLTMELLQWLNAVVAHGGHVADVNDLLANTLGAPIGYGLLRAALLLPPLRRLAGAATWPTAPHDEPELQPA